MSLFSRKSDVSPGDPAPDFELAGSDGRIVAAVIGVGGFLGIGEKEVSVPFGAVRVMRSDKDWYLLIDATKDALSNAPAYQQIGDRVRLDPRPAGTQK